MITIRCSSLPRIMSCPASLEVGEVQIQSSSDNASIGSAVHEVMADIIRSGDFNMPDLYPYSARHGVDVEEIRFLCWRGLAIWKQFANSLVDIDVENEEKTAIESTENGTYKTFLTGHVDVSAKMYDEEDEGRGVIIDWKTGIERDSDAQLMGYAALHFLGWPVGVKIITANLRENIVTIFDKTDEDIYQFVESVADVVNMEQKPYNPTADNCQYCPRRLDCPAKAKLAESSVMAMASVHSNHSLTTPEQLAGLYDAAESLSRTLEQYKDALKMAVKDEGSLKLTDGRVLTLEECERETISANCDFWLTAQTFIGGTEEAETADKIGEDAFTVKKQAVIKAVRDAAPKGEKDAAEKRFMKELRSAGCVKTTKFDKIVCRKG